jgi:hypothetical protein
MLATGLNLPRAAFCCTRGGRFAWNEHNMVSVLRDGRVKEELLAGQHARVGDSRRRGAVARSRCVCSAHPALRILPPEQGVGCCLRGSSCGSDAAVQLLHGVDPPRPAGPAPGPALHAAPAKAVRRCRSRRALDGGSAAPQHAAPLSLD